jgi:methylated-DNA-[protein]-cysteine S-methyltransferase
MQAIDVFVIFCIINYIFMQSILYISHWLSPLGMLEIRISDQSLLSMKKSNTKKEHISDDPVTRTVIRQLEEYLEGRRQTFDLPLHVDGTPFQQAVWKALGRIPAGKTLTYGQVAAMIGKPNAARAVGNALNRNLHCIVVPCHRVTAGNGMGGYAFGVAMKKKLLELEGAL